MAAYTVIFDACVLYPAPLRDLLIELAAANLFRAKWTARIQDEWISALKRHRPEISLERLERTKQLMELAVLDSVVTGYEFLENAITLPDPKDRHVVAAGIQAKANAIVTFNLTDFPATALVPYNLEAIHPDDFLNYQIDLNEAAVVLAAQRCLRRLKSPPKTSEDYLDTLEKQQLPKSVSRLRSYAAVL